MNTNKRLSVVLVVAVCVFLLGILIGRNTLTYIDYRPELMALTDDGEKICKHNEQIRPEFMKKSPKDMTDEELHMAVAIEKDIAKRVSENRIIKVIIDRLDTLEERILKKTDSIKN